MKHPIRNPWAAGAAGLLGLGVLAGAARAQDLPAPVQFQIQYDTSKGPGHPDEQETLANVLYPIGKGPLDQGYPAEPLPVLIILRGGNSNGWSVGDVVFEDQTQSATPFGMIGIRPNMPVVQNGEDYNVSADAVARLIQHVRWRAEELNADPERIFLVGRSFGCVVAYAVAYKQDHANPAGGPELSQSSRPGYLAARLGPSHLPCFGADISSWAPTMGLFFFPGKAFEDASPIERELESPTWWLRNPEVFGRTSTPITAVVFHQSYTDTCSTNIDVHSGLFGDLMLSALRQYAHRTGEHKLAEPSAAIDLDVVPDASDAVAVWAVERLAEDGGGLHLSPPVGAVDSGTGGTMNLFAFGAEPGATLALYRSKVFGGTPVAGCGSRELGLAAPQLVATAVAADNGAAAFSYTVAGVELGTIDLLQAVDEAHCEISQVSVHRYY